ncbi:solute carrier family 23 protein [Tsukamurella paurometabola]|uniref:solute carrier family 23 protein n=1 Tax=Tsukamurella paurometabola TaxID=2061 RepID=UPI00032347AF|nr:solute carrier family 23 protein [Tsukamurella paurometabola]
MIRTDAITSLFVGLFGGQTMITTGENIGIVSVTGVRSRYVTATAGLLLAAVAPLAPLGTLIASLPAPVIGGTAAYVFAMMAVAGLRTLGSLAPWTTGIPPPLSPASLQVTADPRPRPLPRTPAAVRPVLSSGVTMTAAVAAVFEYRRQA